MLRELRVRNFAIVEDGFVKLGSGMTAFTGETGAGKSLLLDAVTLLLGSKAHSHLVRAGAPSAEVEGVFDLSQDPQRRECAQSLGFEVDEEEGAWLLVRREIAGGGEAGRNRIWIQGRAATRAQLQELLGDWVEISGQHEFLRLGNENYLLSIVDQYGNLKTEVEFLNREYLSSLEHQKRYESLLETQQHWSSRRDYLVYLIEELEKAGVSPEAEEEEQRLLALRMRLGNVEKIRQSLERVRSQLEGHDSSELSQSGALQSLQVSVRELSGCTVYGAEFTQLHDALEILSSQLWETTQRVHDLADQWEADPASLDDAEARLSLLNRVKRKYACGISELVEKLSQARQEYEKLENPEQRLQELETLWKEARRRLEEKAKTLHEKRTRAAAALSSAWQKDLRKLGMKEAVLKLAPSLRESCGPEGITRMEAMFSANPGEALKPLSKVASGGELSRVLLALKHIVAGRSEIGVYLFDEVDAGIGGETAHAVAVRLRDIAQTNQVIVVTHLAQIAAAAHDQWRIHKTLTKGRTRTLIERVTQEERLEEIARMLGSTRSSTAKKLAQELLCGDQSI